MDDNVRLPLGPLLMSNTAFAQILPSHTMTNTLRPRHKLSPPCAPFPTNVTKNNFAAKEKPVNHPNVSGSPTASDNSAFSDLTDSEVVVAALATSPRSLRRSARIASLEQENNARAEFEREVLDAFQRSRQMSIKKKRREKKLRLKAKRASKILQYSTHVVVITQEQLAQNAREDALARLYEKIDGPSILDEISTEEHTTYVENAHDAAMDLPFEICARRMQPINQEIDRHGWLEGWKYAALARALDDYYRLFSDTFDMTLKRKKRMAAEESAMKQETIENATQVLDPRDIFPEFYFYERVQY